MHSFEKLDNPAWWALSETHERFAVGHGQAKAYRQEILPIMAIAAPSPESFEDLDKLVGNDHSFYMVGSLPAFPSGWTVLKELPCYQMVQGREVAADGDETIHRLGDRHRDLMFELVNRVQPGLFRPDTYLLGSYYGIFDEDRLVAIGGQRMRLEGFTEVSAICTDPAYTGRGYARQLTARVCHDCRQEGVMPILHVLQSNERAMRIYEHLGFRTRIAITFWQLKKTVQTAV